MLVPLVLRTSVPAEVGSNTTPTLTPPVTDTVPKVVTSRGLEAELVNAPPLSHRAKVLFTTAEAVPLRVKPAPLAPERVVFGAVERVSGAARANETGYSIVPCALISPNCNAAAGAELGRTEMAGGMYPASVTLELEVSDRFVAAEMAVSVSVRGAVEEDTSVAPVA